MGQIKFDKSRQIALIREWIAKGECIDITLTTGEDSPDGIPLAVSDTFVVILLINEWHADGVCIIPLDKVADIQPYPDRRKILAWNGVETTNRYFWLDIESYSGLFQSLKKPDQFISVEDGDEFDVAVVVAVTPEFAKLSAIGADGEWLGDFLDYDYEDITIIRVDSEYANVLGAYCRQTTTKR